MCGKAEISVSHDPSAIVLMCRFGAQERFIISVENSHLLINAFLWKPCQKDSLNKMSKQMSFKPHAAILKPLGEKIV